MTANMEPAEKYVKDLKNNWQIVARCLSPQDELRRLAPRPGFCVLLGSSAALYWHRRLRGPHLRDGCAGAVAVALLSLPP